MLNKDAYKDPFSAILEDGNASQDMRMFLEFSIPCLQMGVGMVNFRKLLKFFCAKPLKRKEQRLFSLWC